MSKAKGMIKFMNGLLILNMIVPFVLVLVGVIMKKFPVSDMHSQNGYNTPVSRKSQMHWDYAQKIAPDIFISMGKWLFVIETIVIIVSLIFQIPAVISVFAGTCTGFAVLFGGFFYTDSKIEEFVNGKRR